MKLATSAAELQKALSTLEESVNLYHKAIEGSPEAIAFRDASIQRFEYCIELSWKTSTKLLGSRTAAAKPAIREMARNDLVSNAEQWLQFIEARNNTSHSYDEGIAKAVFVTIEQFIPACRELIVKLGSL